MTQTIHRFYIGSMVSIVLAVTLYLYYTGYSYYQLPIEERFYHPRHDWFKPSGILGHGLGILGTLFIVIGVSIYILRKRYQFLSRYIRLKFLLEFHIFLCVLGPILIVFHTAFKVGGLVSIAFWSMVAVVASGVVGRFIYIQIPRSIEGRAFTLAELNDMKVQLVQQLKSSLGNIDSTLSQIQMQSISQDKSHYLDNMKKLKSVLKNKGVSKKEQKSILKLFKDEFKLSRRIRRLDQMQRLFQYWHVAHMPFALIMLVIVVIHVIVTLAFGYRWIF